ncbi:alpha/beta hydrolase [Echinicola jeungdonensis]|uniref:alpha/beta hydrolase n=1 Tax=Echinicola jeungdonensis TaxID=709343 RepID=UPI0025B54A2E|nr:alpha/beta hydrolase [Echinicola jeungdonensis]MDN3668916.1 alpha/beta hydrolase [Echinicola jeungdonensis]
MKLKRVEERERITQVDQPGLYAFFTSNEENTGSAVLICPPGGYQKLTYNIAGLQIAKWFNTIGVNAFVLIHRLPTSPDLIKPAYGSLQDAQRAMKIIRARAKDWGIDPQKVGVYGSSAGGNVATTLSTLENDYAGIGDSLDAQGFLPNFQILVSPVVSMIEHFHEGSREALLGENPSEELVSKFSSEKQVKENTPPAFIVHADNDPVVSSMNSILYYIALKEKGVNASLHIFPQGGHSIALRNNPGSANQWTAICETWMDEMNLFH